ncbi:MULTISPECIES: YchJ family protein [unclassified Thiocapsa]|uniref:YchJ family protein n=1 Tax=unclassified Thiocapsa TaxID=2641286 RepID=UPI0035B2511D
MTQATPCPCGGPRPYERCCGPYLDAAALPPGVEALMRSRYVAYVMDRTDYILSTWHPRTRPPKLDQDRAPVRWLGLTIRRVEAGTPEDREGLVEFVARYKVGGRAHRLHETSRFVKEDGRWLYLEAVAPD